MKRGLKRKKTRQKAISGQFVTGVRRIPSSSEAARDEGPRLIPLGENSKDPSRLEHYLDLADIALGSKHRPKTK